MDISGMIKDAIGDKLRSQFNLSQDKIDGIVGTISAVVSGQKGGIAGKIGGLLGGGNNDSEMGNEIKTALVEKNNLDGDMASKIKDMVLPIIMKAIKGGLGDKFSGAMGKFGL